MSRSTGLTMGINKRYIINYGLNWVEYIFQMTDICVLNVDVNIKVQYLLVSVFSVCHLLSSVDHYFNRGGSTKHVAGFFYSLVFRKPAHKGGMNSR